MMVTDSQTAEFDRLLSQLSYDDLLIVEKYMKALVAGDTETVARMEREIDSRRKDGSV